MDPSIPRDRDELATARVELLLARASDSLAQHGQDLILRASIHEDHEAEAELLLVHARSGPRARRVRTGRRSRLVRRPSDAERPVCWPIAGWAARASTFSSSLSVARTSSARSSGSSISARRSTRRVRPSKSSLSSSTLSCRGSSRIRTARRGAGRGSGRPRARLRARHARRTRTAARTRGHSGPARDRRPARRCGRRHRSRRPTMTSRPRASSTRTPAAGLPVAVSRTCVETETLMRRIFAPAPDGRARSPSRRH